MAGIRMTGLISNMDTESIVTQLMEAQRTKVTKIENKKTKLEWQQDKWKDLNAKLYKLYQEQTSELRLQGNYSTKKATSADESVVKVTAGNSATSGTHIITVEELASAQYVTGGKIDSADFNKNKRLIDLGFADNQVISIQNGSKTVELNVGNSTTVNDFLTTCSNAGLSASYDATQKRIFISSKYSGEENTFSITTASYTSEGTTAREGIFSLVSSSDKATTEAYLATLKKGGDTTVIESSLKELAKKNINDEASSVANNFYFQVAKNNVNLTVEEESEIESKYSTIVDEDERNKSIEVAKLKKIDDKTKELVATEEYQNKIKSAIQNGLTSQEVKDELGITDATEINKFVFSDKVSRENFVTSEMESAISTYKSVISSGDSTSSSDASSPLKSLGLGEISNVTSDKTASGISDFTVVAAKNSKIIYNGVEMKNTSNNITVNGLTFEVISKSSSPISITVSNDTDAVYKKVKNFITQYNSILKDLNDAYYADSARGYDPLTDEEKDAMTDDQITLWEDKIKKSLLRRDSTLGSLTTAMKTAMSSTVKVNGTTYSLASFGIMTSTDYTEKGLLHIYGDKEDSTYSDKDDKLKAAIEADPDAFAEAFSGIVKNLHDTLYKKMAKTSISSALTFYNDKTIKNQISSYEKNISTLENKLSDMENRYYKQFSAMETALAKLQSQQSALSGLLGTS
mgnify:CR=1 FL=1|nr:flagellar filament capping protein FliD [uncultured Anaerosporobacter sp.]